MLDCHVEFECDERIRKSAVCSGFFSDTQDSAAPLDTFTRAELSGWVGVGRGLGIQRSSDQLRRGSSLVITVVSFS